MTFDEILDQVITLLKRQGRVSYPALKIRFSLDDEYLDALKAEIIEAQQLATDENGRVLVWAGNTAEPSAFVSQPPQTTQPPAAQAQHSPQVAPRVTASPPPDAERRQLTVMFCDLVDSTKLSSQLDPEDLRDIVRAYQKVCSDIITRFDGHIAQLLGDGLLVYFGYPQAHEDDAQRAVRAGLGMLAAMGDLNQGLQQAKGIQLTLRQGIHTGLVVVGEMGGAGRQEQLALGETPNIAARIQGLAAPNTMVISAATYRLIQGYYECQALGAQELRGVAEPVAVYRVLQASGARGRLDVAVTRGLTPLVGRESEVTLLLERWEQAKSGQGQVVLLSGDAGIGKSRLVQMLKEHIANEPHTRWECRSSPYFENTALFPLTDLFQRLWQFATEDTPDEKLGKLEQALSQYRLPFEETVPLFTPLLILPLPEDRYPLLNLSPQRQRQKTLETIVALLLEQAEQHPVLFIVEDLHWTDPTTLELLHLVIEQIPTTSILTVLTCRPHFQPAWHHRSYLTEMTLNHLSQSQIVRMVERIAGGKPLPAQVLAHLTDKTDGVPLFVEEMTKAILESGHLKDVDGHYELIGAFSTFAIPATLQDALMARLDRLVTAKAVAQYAAVIGRQFSYALLQAVSQLDASTLQRDLGRLVEAEIVYQRGLPPHSTYMFKHALIQDAAYQSLLKSTRQHYHQRIAQVLEAQFPETAEAEPELLAHHLTEAGLTAQAIVYWQQAGQRAGQRSANLEAVVHLTKGLALLKTLPDSLMAFQQELDMQVALGLALMMLKSYGAPEVEQAYARARELCQHVGETPQLFPVLQGLWAFYFGRAAHQTARELGEQLLGLAQRVQDPTLLLQAHRALGISLFYLGELAPGHAHLEQGAALYDPQQHRSLAFSAFQNPGVTCRCFAARTLWYLGFPDQALARSRAGLSLAQDVAHPFSLAFALNVAALVQQLRREGHGVQERAEAAITLAREQGFTFYEALGTIQRGWSLVAQGQHVEGIEQMRQGLAAYRATGSAVALPYYLALLVEAYATGGQVAEGLRVLAEAFALVDTHGERDYQAELYRLKGELLLAQGGTRPQWREAEQCFHDAIEMARRQQAKSLELRAAMSLSRLWQQQGKQAEARALLAPIYGWFTEGFDTAHILPNYVVEDTTTHRKPPEVRICRLRNQSAVGTRPPSTSTPH